MSNGKQTIFFKIAHYIAEFGDECTWVLWDTVNFGRVHGKRGLKRLLFVDEADEIKNGLTQHPKEPYVKELIQKARALKTRLDQDPLLTQSAIAKEMRISRVRITQILNLLKLAPEIQQRVLAFPKSNDKCRVTELMLRTLCRISDFKHQYGEFKKITK